ncbi:MAG TPA: hypothetical protein VK153_02305 [Candidatus Paceibacterota bacterium]|nr:hypothetical protein [Candidatus Paceibacterota bacterium]
MHIAVDVDDTIADLISNIILFHNDKYGTTLKREDFFSCWYREVWGGTKEQEVQKLVEFFETNYFKEVAPIPGSQSAMNFLLNEGHKLSIVTGRIYALTKQTEEWVEKYFPNVFSEIYHTNSYGSSGVKIKKSEMCRSQNMDVIIDDDLSHVADCTNVGIPVVVYDCPWNRAPLPKGSIRMNSWEEIPKLINKINIKACS